MEKEKYTKLFVILCAVSITFLLVSNIVATKTVMLFGMVFAAADVIFPITYILGDIFTEVYGFKKAKFVIWLSFLCNLIMVIGFYIAISIQGSPEFTNQEAMESILGSTPRVLIASFIAYVVGNLANSFIMSKMKIKTQGKYLPLRTITSTVVGELFDTMIFVPFVFVGVLDFATIVNMIVSVFLIKLSFEVILTPVTYNVIKFIKKKEGIDTFDKDVKYSII